MKSIILYLVFLTFTGSIACNKNTEKINSDKPAKDSSESKTKTVSNSPQNTKDDRYYIDSVFYVHVNKNLQASKFEIWRTRGTSVSPHFNDLYKIAIYDSVSGNLLQTIDSAKMSDVYVQLEFDDYNFDGFQDIYIKDGCAILGNCHGIILLYDQNKKLFDIAHAFDEMTSVTASQKKKMIFSISRSAAGASFEYGKYIYLNGALTLIESETQDIPETSGGKYHYILTRRDENGVMKTISDQYLKKPKELNFDTEE